MHNLRGQPHLTKILSYFKVRCYFRVWLQRFHRSLLQTARTSSLKLSKLVLRNILRSGNLIACWATEQGRFEWGSWTGALDSPSQSMTGLQYHTKTNPIKISTSILKPHMLAFIRGSTCKMASNRGFSHKYKLPDVRRSVSTKLSLKLLKEGN